VVALRHDTALAFAGLVRFVARIVEVHSIFRKRRRFCILNDNRRRIS
jgi:hypothetical protein